MKHRRRKLGIAGAALLFAVALSCRNRSGDDGRGNGASSGSPAIDAGAFDKASLLRAFAECAFGTYKEAAAAAALLDTATRTAEADPTKRAAAQDAWKTTMDAWQRAELFQFGPAAMTGSPGARDMRDPIYAWPLVSRCQIEQAIVDKLYETPDYVSLSLVSTRSLAALEYLLFYDGVENACPPSDALNAQGKWGALGPDEIAKRKATYARILTADNVARTQKLVDAWDPAKENFLATFASPPNATFSTQQMAFNAVSDAMFYLDLTVKNLKVGKPAGFTPDCTTAPCLDAVESPWAKRSKQHIRANMEGFERLLMGCGPGGTGLGFDDLLAAVGAQAVADKLATSLSSSRAALDALTEPTFEEDIQKNPNGVRALFDAMRSNSSTMKSEFATVLDLELPKKVEGDND
jgi:predicted lipoprotein